MSTAFDQRLLADDCSVLADHADRLCVAGLLSEQERDAAVAALRALASLTPSEVVTAADEDVHSAVERRLLAELPTIAPKLRAGLSRNDRVASASRRWLRRTLTAVRTDVLVLVDTLVARAEEHADDLAPGYTHLQRAQPVTLGHHLLAHAWALLRDVDRLADAERRAGGEPLGAGALAGSTLPLPAPAGQIPNSLDAVAARDHVAESLAACAILGAHLSRIGEEIVLWTSSEFGFVELDDAWATGSSLMPQKKNPDVAELVRGKMGRLVGDLTSALVTMKSLPLSYNRDLQEDKEPIFDATDTLLAGLPAVTGMMASCRFRLDRLAEAASDPMLLATDLADALVLAGVAFRDAHDIVGAAVIRAAASENAFDSFADDAGLLAHLGEPSAIRAILDPARSVAARLGNGPGTVASQLVLIRSEISARRT